MKHCGEGFDQFRLDPRGLTDRRLNSFQRKLEAFILLVTLVVALHLKLDAVCLLRKVVQGLTKILDLTLKL
jgi:hypothetical protein